MLYQNHLIRHNTYFGYQIINNCNQMSQHHASKDFSDVHCSVKLGNNTLPHLNAIAHLRHVDKKSFPNSKEQRESIQGTWLEIYIFGSPTLMSRAWKYYFDINILKIFFRFSSIFLNVLVVSRKKSICFEYLSQKNILGKTEENK